MSIQKYSKYKREELEQYSNEVQLKFLLGVINAKYMDHILALLRGDDYHIYPEHVRNIPIPSATITQQENIIKIVDVIVDLKQQNPQADTSELETQIDILVYLLYKLTYDEVKIIDPQIESIISESDYNKRLAENV